VSDILSNKNLIIGAGFSASITRLLIKAKNINLIGAFNHKGALKVNNLRRSELESNKILSKKAYSYGSLKFQGSKFILHDRLIKGGNSKIWGGHINLSSVPKSLILFLQKKKIKFINLCFERTGTVSNDNKIKQLQNNKNKILDINDLITNVKDGFIDYLYFKKKKIFVSVYLSNKNKSFTFPVKKLFLCIGPIQLLDLLYRSKLLNNKDVIQLSEFKHEFELNLINTPLDKKKITIRYRLDRAIGHFFGIQFYSKFLKIFKFLPFCVDQNFYLKKNYIKFKLSKNNLLKISNNLSGSLFGSSIHYCNLKINGIDINSFFKKKNPNIFGFGMSFVDQKSPGPISNDIILDVLKKLKKINMLKLNEDR
jgi:hypothetical protein